MKTSTATRYEEMYWNRVVSIVCLLMGLYLALSVNDFFISPETIRQAMPNAEMRSGFDAAINDLN